MKNINESTLDIRKTMNDIKSRLNENINESLVFNKMVKPKKEEEELLKDNQNMSREADRNVDYESFDIKPRLKQIRKIVITTMADIDPSDCPDDYKTFKSILDICDKSFTKSNEKQSKE